MPDEKTGSSLPQKSIPYHRAVWQRVWSDLWQILGARMKLAVVSTISVGVNACVIAYYVGGPGEMSVPLYSGLMGIATVCATFATTLLVYFLFYYLVVTPSNIYGDNQKEIADLKSQLDLQLNLHVTVSSVSPMDPGAFRDLQLSQDGLVIFLQDIRFTNRSVTHNVSLELTLMVPGRGGYYRVTEGKEHWEIFHHYFLFTPIDIDPQKTISGNMCFLVSPETVRNCGGKRNLNYNHCRLKICDRVSGKKMDKDIRQEALESQQIMRDTPVWYNEE